MVVNESFHRIYIISFLFVTKIRITFFFPFKWLKFKLVVLTRLYTLLYLEFELKTSSQVKTKQKNLPQFHILSKYKISIYNHKVSFGCKNQFELLSLNYAE